MLANMQRHALGMGTLIDFAKRNRSDAQIASSRVVEDVRRTTWRQVAARARRLDGRKISGAERVAAIAWNGYQHLEVYCYSVSASGRVLRTLTPRLSPVQLAWIINGADDHVVRLNLNFLPLAQTVSAQCPEMRHWMALSNAERLPDGDEQPAIKRYEALLDGESNAPYTGSVFNAKAASSLYYTSDTTDNPKGVLYSHLSKILHAYTIAIPHSMSLSSRNCVLSVVPMYPFNARGTCPQPRRVQRMNLSSITSCRPAPAQGAHSCC